jgi:hypothetical protein
MLKESKWETQGDRGEMASKGVSKSSVKTFPFSSFGVTIVTGFVRKIRRKPENSQSSHSPQLSSRSFSLFGRIFPVELFLAGRNFSLGVLYLSSS